jgi:hypothetical protein
MDRSAKIIGNWHWLRIIGALLFGSLFLMMILPSTGCIYNPALDRFAKGMWHWGPYAFYPDALFYIGFITVSTACVIYGALRRNKFEIVGWGLLGFLFVGMILDG